MILSDRSIRIRCTGIPHLPDADRLHLLNSQPMLDPFCERTIHKESGTSFGLGPCTYDVRTREGVTLQPKGFALLSTLERFAMPLNVCATVQDKSSLARIGLAFQNTHIDPGWQGYLTLEVSNNTDTPITILAGQPVVQIKFEMVDQVVEKPYSGKYQNQEAKPIGIIKEGHAS